MQLVLGKKHIGNERIYRKRMFAKSRIEIEILENLRKPLTRKSTKKRVDIDLALKGFFLFTHWRGSQKKKTFGFVQVA